MAFPPGPGTLERAGAGDLAQEGAPIGAAEGGEGGGDKRNWAEVAPAHSYRRNKSLPSAASASSVEKNNNNKKYKRGKSPRRAWKNAGRGGVCARPGTPPLPRLGLVGQSLGGSGSLQPPAGFLRCGRVGSEGRVDMENE